MTYQNISKANLSEDIQLLILDTMGKCLSEEWSRVRGLVDTLASTPDEQQVHRELLVNTAILCTQRKNQIGECAMKVAGLVCKRSFPKNILIFSDDTTFAPGIKVGRSYPII